MTTAPTYTARRTDKGIEVVVTLPPLSAPVARLLVRSQYPKTVLENMAMNEAQRMGMFTPCGWQYSERGKAVRALLIAEDEK